MPYVINCREAKPVSLNMNEWSTRFETNGHDDLIRKKLKIVKAWANGSRPLDDEEFPRKLILEEKIKTIDWFKGANRILIISKKLKSIIEKLDGDLHQYSPVSVYDKQGNALDVEHYVLNVMASFEFVDLNKTRHTNTLKKSDTHRILSANKVIFNSNTQITSNLWRDPRCRGEMFASDTLIEAVNADGLKIIKNYKAKPSEELV